MKDLSYSTISKVIDSWEAARLQKGKAFYEELGPIILKRLFELEPNTKLVFGFSKGADTNNGLFKMGSLIHGKRILEMLDTTLSMLGPDTELLEEVLQDLGKRHANYGVKPNYFPFMGKAITYALSKTLKDWNEDTNEAWEEVYNELSQVIVASMLK